MEKNKAISISRVLFKSAIYNAVMEKKLNNDTPQDFNIKYYNISIFSLDL